MNQEFVTTPSIAEINEVVERARRERNQYIVAGVRSLAAKTGTALRSLFETTISKPSPSH